MTIKITIPNTSSDVLTFGSANTPTAAQIAGIDSGSSNGQLALYTTASGTSTERVRIDVSGNVGIGTSSPAYKLDVVNSSETSYAQVKGANSGTTITTPGNGGATVFLMNTNSTANTFNAIYGVDAGENVTSGVAFINNSDANNEGTMAFMTRPSGGSITERMRIDSSGNLLVGATSGGSSGVAGIVKAVGYNTKAGTSASLNTNNFNINFGTGAQLWIDSTNLGTFSFTSDYRIKKDIQTQTLSALNRILQLRPVTYEFGDYKDLFKADGIAREGFIAHELQAVIPSAVDGEKDAEDQIQSLRLDALCSVLVKAIQEMKAIIDTQASTITQLQADVAALKGASA
jgi:hypothetical protein